MKLSIITINYNNRKGLLKTIDSIVSQTWRDFEWIVIDGGSTDGSKELIEQYKEGFAYWCSEADRGIYNAMNKGLSHAKGEYVSFMNSGDTFFNETILKSVFTVERRADILYGDWMLENGIIMKFPFPIELYSFFHHNICHQAMFVRTKILIEKRFDESYILLADYKRWIEAAMDNNTFDYLRIIICKFEAGGATGRLNQTRDQEVARIHNEAYPSLLRLSFEKLDQYDIMSHTRSWYIFQKMIRLEKRIDRYIKWWREKYIITRIRLGSYRKRFFK